MPTPALLLVIATLLPLAAFVLLMFLGKRLGNPLAGIVGTAFIGGSFVCAMAAMVMWLNVVQGSTWGADKGPINIPLKWIPVGEGIDQDNRGYLDIGIYGDSLTIAMFTIVTLFSTVVHVLSIGCM